METLKKSFLFQEAICKAQKTNKKSDLKKFLVSYDVCTIFISVEQIPCEAKKQTKVDIT